MMVQISVLLSGVGSQKIRHRADNHIFKNNANNESLANFLSNNVCKTLL